MELPDQKYEEIEEYLLGTLSPEKKDALEKEMEMNQELKDEFEIYHDIFSSTKRLKQQEDIQVLVKKVLNAPVVVKKTFWQRHGVLMSSLAACIAILILFFFLIPNKTAFNLRKPNAISLEEQMEKAKNQFTTAGKVLKIEELVDISGDSIEFALTLIDTHLDSFPNDKNYLLVGGLLQMKKGERQPAIQYWEQVFQNDAFSCIERYKFSKLIFWALYEPLDKEALLKFRTQWQVLEDCPELANFSDKEKEEKDNILWVLSYLDVL